MLTYTSFSQLSMRWKRTRYEVITGFGVANLMGDLGGGSNPNSKFDDYFGDFDFKATRPTLNLALRYKASLQFSLRYSLSYGMLKGDDRYSGDPNREQRNLHFRSFLFENSLLLEYNIIKESNARKWSKNRSKMRRGISFNWYLYAGVGGFAFNPKAKYDGKWYALQPLGTEGQTYGDYLLSTIDENSTVEERKQVLIEVGNSPKGKYNRVQACFPIGTGIKFGLTRLIDVGVDYGFRFTSTDYLDDVGGSYFDNFKIIEANSNSGELTESALAAGWLADSHIPGETDIVYDKNAPFPYEEGDRIPFKHGLTTRSGDALDSYMFFQFTLSYKLKTKRNGLPKFR